MFSNPNPYKRLGQIGKMPKNCPVCDTPFEPEPGFYFGAMFISYAIAAPTWLIIFAILYYLLGMSFEWIMLIVVIVQLLITPYLFHVSRAIYLYFHVHTDSHLLRSDSGNKRSPIT
jgi:hypothetical protein